MPSGGPWIQVFGCHVWQHTASHGLPFSLKMKLQWHERCCKLFRTSNTPTTTFLFRMLRRGLVYCHTRWTCCSLCLLGVASLNVSDLKLYRKTSYNLIGFFQVEVGMPSAALLQHFEGWIARLCSKENSSRPCLKNPIQIQTFSPGFVFKFQSTFSNPTITEQVFHLKSEKHPQWGSLHICFGHVEFLGDALSPSSGRSQLFTMSLWSLHWPSSWSSQSLSHALLALLCFACVLLGKDVTLRSGILPKQSFLKLIWHGFSKASTGFGLGFTSIVMDTGHTKTDCPHFVPFCVRKPKICFGRASLQWKARTLRCERHDTKACCHLVS